MVEADDTVQSIEELHHIEMVAHMQRAMLFEEILECYVNEAVEADLTRCLSASHAEIANVDDEVFRAGQEFLASYMSRLR